MPKDYPETHWHGVISIEQTLHQGSEIKDFGIQIAKDGRVWICFNGVAAIRFKPLTTKEYARWNLTNTT